MSKKSKKNGPTKIPSKLPKYLNSFLEYVEHDQPSVKREVGVVKQCVNEKWQKFYLNNQMSTLQMRMQQLADGNHQQQQQDEDCMDVTSGGTINKTKKQQHSTEELITQLQRSFHQLNEHLVYLTEPADQHDLCTKVKYAMDELAEPFQEMFDLYFKERQQRSQEQERLNQSLLARRPIAIKLDVPMTVDDCITLEEPNQGRKKQKKRVRFAENEEIRF
jgi:hypothetical protein